MATHVGIINHGELVFQGSIKELGSLSQPLVRIETGSTVDAANFLTRSGVTVTDVNDHQLFIPYEGKEQMGSINTLLVNGGFTVFSIDKQQQDLEKLFLAITQNA